MTAPTPEQMRALASEHAQEAAEYELDRFEKQDQPEYGDGYEYEDKITWHQNTAAALRAAADQLEAVQVLLTEAHNKFAATYDAERMIGRGPSSIGVAGPPLASSVQRALDLLRAKATANIERLTADTAPQAETCWACARENTTDVPEGDIPLCTKHWNWWVMRWLNAADEPPCAAHLITAPQQDRDADFCTAGTHGDGHRCRCEYVWKHDGVDHVCGACGMHWAASDA